MTALTLAEMHVAQWEVRATCNRCRTQLKINLGAMIRAHGPDAVLWGRRPRCPGFDCDGGRLSYSARAIASSSWVSMTERPGRSVVAAWEAKRRLADRGPRNL